MKKLIILAICLFVTQSCGGGGGVNTNTKPQSTSGSNFTITEESHPELYKMLQDGVDPQSEEFKSALLKAAMEKKGNNKPTVATNAVKEEIIYLPEKTFPDIYKTIRGGNYATDAEFWAKLRKIAEYREFSLSIKNSSNGEMKVYLDVGVKGNAPEMTAEEKVKRALNEGDLDTVKKYGKEAVKAYNKNPEASSLVSDLAFGKGSHEVKLKILRAMLEHGLNPNIKGGKYGDALTVTYINKVSYNEDESLKEKHAIDYLKVLFEYGADPDISDSHYDTALNRAVFFGYYKVADFVIENGADVNARHDRSGHTPVRAMFHFINNHDGDELIEKVGYLIKKGADLNSSDEEGETALHYAAAACEGTDNLKLVKLLVESGAEVNKGTPSGVTPLSSAKLRHCKDNMAFLKSKGGVLVNGGFALDNDGEAVQAVLKKDFSKIKSLDKKLFEEIKARSLLDVPVTALHVAVEEGDRSVIKALNDKGVNWMSVDQYGSTPLHSAVLVGRSDVAEMLIGYGADPGKTNNWGVSSLSIAASKDRELALLMVSKAEPLKYPGGIYQATYTGDLELAKKIYKATKDFGKDKKFVDDFMESVMTGTGREVAKYFYNEVKWGKVSKKEFFEKNEEWNDKVESFYKKAQATKDPKKLKSGLYGKKGRIPYTVEEWDPEEGAAVDRDLKDYPVHIYVPDSYDGSKPFGVMLYMHGRRGDGKFYPNAGYTKIMDKYNLIWVGYSAYNGLYESFKGNHEKFNMAVLYNMKKYFNLDSDRIFMSGLSWGGRLTCQIMGTKAHIFKGGISMGGCGNLGFSEATVKGAETSGVVIMTGDHDYNRKESYIGYSFFIKSGFKRAYYIQEPKLGHTYATSQRFEDALKLLDY